MHPIDPADLTMLYAIAVVAVFALGMLAGRWSQRRQDAPFLRLMRERLYEANVEIEKLRRKYASWN